VAKRENVIDVSLLEYSVREHLNKIATRVMVVMDPIKLIITNYPEGQTEQLISINNPEDESAGTRETTFSREIYIERSDFMIDPPKKFFRLGPGLSTRLKDAYKVTCDDYKLNEETGEVEEIYCTYHPDSKSGQDTSNIPVKSTIHWVDVNTAVDMEIRLYDRLFMDEAPGAHKDRDFLEFLNPDSLQIINGKAEASLKEADLDSHYQFMRMGYFCPDPDSTKDHLVFNRTVTLKDAWAKMNK
jgi:glutaminyl-tRNA synthetase